MAQEFAIGSMYWVTNKLRSFIKFEEVREAMVIATEAKELAFGLTTSGVVSTVYSQQKFSSIFSYHRLSLIVQ